MNSLPVNNSVIHPAKVDWWVAAVFGGVPILQVALATFFFLAGLTGGAIIGIAVAALMTSFLWGCYSTRYEITASDLIIRFGPFRTTIPLPAIVEVFPTRNPLSAPAPSLDRLRVDYRNNGVSAFVLISPRDKEGFVRDLAGAAPHLRSVGDTPMRLKADQPA